MIKAAKLMNLASAYWKGDEKKTNNGPGLCWYHIPGSRRIFQMLEEAKERSS